MSEMERDPLFVLETEPFLARLKEFLSEAEHDLCVVGRKHMSPRAVIDWIEFQCEEWADSERTAITAQDQVVEEGAILAELKALRAEVAALRRVQQLVSLWPAACTPAARECWGEDPDGPLIRPRRRPTTAQAFGTSGARSRRVGVPIRTTRTGKSAAPSASGSRTACTGPGRSL